MESGLGHSDSLGDCLDDFLDNVWAGSGPYLVRIWGLRERQSNGGSKHVKKFSLSEGGEFKVFPKLQGTSIDNF